MERSEDMLFMSVVQTMEKVFSVQDFFLAPLCLALQYWNPSEEFLSPAHLITSETNNNLCLEIISPSSCLLCASLHFILCLYMCFSPSFTSSSYFCHKGVPRCQTQGCEEWMLSPWMNLQKTNRVTLLSVKHFVSIFSFFLRGFNICLLPEDIQFKHRQIIKVKKCTYFFIFFFLLFILSVWSCLLFLAFLNFPFFPFSCHQSNLKSLFSYVL